MLRVTVEIVPFGNESRKRTLGVMEIANDGTGDHDWGMYRIRSVRDEDGNELAPQDAQIRVGPHLREIGFWPLVQRCIRAFLWREG